MLDTKQICYEKIYEGSFYDIQIVDPKNNNTMQIADSFQIKYILISFYKFIRTNLQYLSLLNYVYCVVCVCIMHVGWGSVLYRP